MAVIKALHHIWHDGEKFKPGQVIQNLDTETAERLVKSDAALFVGQQELLMSNKPLPQKEESDSPGEDTRQVIDDNFTLKELTSDAKLFGLDFPSNIQKSALIDLIIEEGKEQNFLDMLEDEEE